MASFRDLYKNSTPAVPGAFTPMSTPFQQTAKPQSYVDGTVDEVLDADTVSLRDALGNRRRVRLANIDAQETGHGPHDPGQPLGAAQRDALAQRVAGKSLRVGVLDTDKYGRMVGTLYDGDTDINKELVRTGSATRAQNAPADYWDAQEQAHKAGTAAYQRPGYQNAGAFRHLVKGTLADPVAERGRFDTVGDSAFTRSVKQTVHGSLAGVKATLADAADVLGMDGSPLRESAKQSMRYASGMARRSDESYDITDGGTAIGRDVGSAAGSVGLVGAGAVAGAGLGLLSRGLVSPATGAKTGGALTSWAMNTGETSANAAADDKVMAETTAAERLGTAAAGGAAASAVELGLGLEGKVLSMGGKHLLNTGGRKAGEGFFTSVLRRIGAGAAKAAPGEGAEEGLQDIIGQEAMNSLRDQDPSNIDWKQVGKSALSGAIGGAALGGVHNPFKRAPGEPAPAAEAPAPMAEVPAPEAPSGEPLLGLPAPGQTSQQAYVSGADGVQMTPGEKNALELQAEREARRAAYEERMKGMYQQHVAEIEQLVQAGAMTPEQAQLAVEGMQEQADEVMAGLSQKTPEQLAEEQAWDAQARWEQEQRDTRRALDDARRTDQTAVPEQSLEALLAQAGVDAAEVDAVASALRAAALDTKSDTFDKYMAAMNLPRQQRDAVRAAATAVLESADDRRDAPVEEAASAEATPADDDAVDATDTGMGDEREMARDAADEERPLGYDDDQWGRVQAANKFRDRGFTLRGADGKPVTFSAHSIVMEEGKNKDSWRPGESDLQRTARLFFEGLGKILTDGRLAAKQEPTHTGTRYTKQFENGTLRKGNAAMVQQLVPSSAPRVDESTGELIDDIALDFPDNMVVRAASKKYGTPAVLWKDIKHMGRTDALPGGLARAVADGAIDASTAKAFARQVQDASNAVYEATHESFGDETAAVRKDVGDALIADAEQAIRDLEQLRNVLDHDAARQLVDRQVRNAEAWLADLEEGVALAESNQAGGYGSKEYDDRADAEQAKQASKARTVEEVNGAPLHAPTQQQLVADAADATAREALRKNEQTVAPGSTARAVDDYAGTLSERQADAAEDETDPTHKMEPAFRSAMRDMADALAAQFAKGSTVQVLFVAGEQALGRYSPYNQTVRLQSFDAWRVAHPDGTFAEYQQVIRQTMAHEIGHHVQWWTFDREAADVKQAVYDAWLADLRSVLDAPTADTFARLFGHPLHDNKQAVAAKQQALDAAGSDAVVDADVQPKLAGLTRRKLAEMTRLEQDVDAAQVPAGARVGAVLLREQARSGAGGTDATYRLGFAEWFANNFARYAESRLAAQTGLKRQQAAAAADSRQLQGFWRKLFKTVGDYFREVKGRRLSPVNESFAQWLNKNTENGVSYGLPPRHNIAHEPLEDDTAASRQAREAVASRALRPTAAEQQYLATRKRDAKTPEAVPLPSRVAAPEYRALASRDDMQHSKFGVDAAFDATQEQMDAATDYLHSILPDDIKVKFQSLTTVAGAASLEKRLIVLSTHALDPTSTAAHEAMHLFVKELRQTAPEVAAALSRWVQSAPVVAALNARLKDSPAALAQLEDTDERIAYAFQFYVADKNFALPPAAKRWFNRLYEYMRAAASYLGFKSDDLQARAAMDLLQAGGWKANGPEGLVDLQLKLREGKLAPVRDAIAPLVAPIKKLMVSQVSRIRDTGLPSLIKLADMLYVEHGVTGAKFKEGYVQEVHRRHNLYADRITKFLLGLNDEQLHKHLANELRGVDSGDAKAKAAAADVKKVLRELLGEMKAAGCEIGDLGPDYFPRVYKPDALEQNKDKFLLLLRQHNVKHPEGVYRAILEGETVENVSGGIQAGTPGRHLGRTRELPESLTKPLQELGVLDNDAVNILRQYVHAAVKRSAYASRFGDDSQRLNYLLDEAKKEGATAPQVKAAIDAVSGMHGTLGANIDPSLRKAQAAVVLYENLRVLTTGILSQLPDVVGIAIKSGNPLDSARALARAVKEAGGYWKEGVTGKQRDMSKTDRWEQVARATGIIENHMLGHMAEAVAGTSWTDGQLDGSGSKWKNLRWLNDKFFALNLMSGWNNSNRALGTKLAADAIASYAKSDSDTALRNMRDLGLEKGDLVYDKDGTLMLSEAEIVAAGGTPEQAEKMSTALHRWVGGAVLRPNAGHRPGWMNDPHFMIFAHLKQFMWTQQKTVLRHIMTEAQLGNLRPLAAASVMYLTAGVFTLYLRAIVKGAGEIPEWLRNKSVAEVMMMGLERSGVFGVRGLVMDIERDWSRGELLTGSLIGPAAKHVTDVVRDASEGELDNLVVGALPTQDAWAQWVLPSTDRALRLLNPLD